MSQPRQPEPFDELRELIHTLHDDRITPEDKAHLEDWVCRDKEARRIYVGYMYLYAWLQWDHRKEAPTLTSPSPPVASPSPVVPVVGLLGDVFRAGANFLSQSFVLTLFLAIGLPAIVIVLLLVDMARQPVPVAPPVVGQIARSHECVWEGVNGAASPGEGLLAGQELRLQSGLVEVAFVDGATVILQGPAVFRLDGAGAGRLFEGSLAATVPPPARGFTIQTPAATVVDLGTDFGVSVDNNGDVETHVFKGQVEVALKPTPNGPALPSRRLREKQAVRVHFADAGRTPQIDMISVAPDRFARSLPGSNTQPHVLFVHRGDADPEAEGWRPRILQVRDLLPIKPDRSVACPVNDGVPAWMMANYVDMREFQYGFLNREFSRETAELGRKKGWALRARIKVLKSGKDATSSCHVSYYGGGARAWSLFPRINADGSQSVLISGTSSLGADKASYEIPNSRDRYVDYEIRCKPGTNDAEVFVDGRCIATGYSRPQTDGWARGVRFGTGRHETKIHVALVEWRLLDESTTTEPARGN